jgi:hypothetical protein
MKTIFYLIPILVSSHIITLNAQIINCSEGSVEIFEITCVGEGDDAYLSFLVSTTNLQLLNVETLPINSTTQVLEGLLDWKFDKTMSKVQYHFGNTPNIFQINAPSPGCAPINLSDLYLLPINSPACIIPTLIITSRSPAPIPTLGQWGLIFLGLAVGIFGIAYIRKPIVIKGLV